MIKWYGQKRGSDTRIKQREDIKQPTNNFIAAVGQTKGQLVAVSVGATSEPYEFHL